MAAGRPDQLHQRSRAIEQLSGKGTKAGATVARDVSVWCLRHGRKPGGVDLECRWGEPLPAWGQLGGPALRVSVFQAAWGVRSKRFQRISLHSSQRNARSEKFCGRFPGSERA